MKSFVRRSSSIVTLCGVMILAVLNACTDPLAIPTDRRVTTVNIDSVVGTDPFVNAPGDSIFATVSGAPIVFATEVSRSQYYNGAVAGAQYVTIQASRYELNSTGYEAMSLRLDGIRDTGTYYLNGPFSTPKQIDPEQPKLYGALYERRRGGGFLETYRSGTPRSSGMVHVVKIDTAQGVMVGTFWFVGYSVELDTTVRIDNGAFRLQLDN